MRAIFLILSILLSQALFSQQPIITEQKKQELTKYIDHFERNKKLMGTVSIFENGKEVFSKTFGKENIESKSIQNRKYAIGSIGKMYVGVLFSKLKEENKINFKEKLSNYFPEIPNAKIITIQQMLNHTSGLKNYVEKDNGIRHWLKKRQTEQAIINEIIRQGVAFQPGDNVRYSNSAYYLLGRILEKKYQKTFRQIIADEITKPLELNNTIAIDATNDTIYFAKSYKKENGDWEEMEEFYYPNVSGAGNIMSTAYDLNKFLNSLFTYKILKKETLEFMLPKSRSQFGLGIMKVPFYKHISYGHGGDTYGTHSIALYNPKNKITFSFSINGEDYPHNKFAIGMLSIIYDKNYQLPKFGNYTPDSNYYSEYEGTYGAKEFPITVKIFQENGKLKAQGKGQPSFILTPVGKHVFEYVKAGVVLEFDVHEDKMILKQAGKKFKLAKL